LPTGFVVNTANPSDPASFVPLALSAAANANALSPPSSLSFQNSQLLADLSNHENLNNLNNLNNLSLPPPLPPLPLHLLSPLPNSHM